MCAAARRGPLPPPNNAPNPDPTTQNKKKTTGTTVYTLGADGLIESHAETWDISAADAFVSTFLPSYGAPPAPPAEELLRR